MASSSRWRVTSAACAVEDDFLLIQSLPATRARVRIFERRYFYITAVLDEKEENPSLSAILPKCLYVVNMDGSNHKFRLPQLSRVPNNGVEGEDYLRAVDSAYDWRLRQHEAKYIEQDDRWITEIAFSGAWDVYLNAGIATVTQLQGA